MKLKLPIYLNPNLRSSFYKEESDLHITMRGKFGFVTSILVWPGEWKKEQAQLVPKHKFEDILKCNSWLEVMAVLDDK